MINYENMRETIAIGLKDYLKCPVIRSNQNATPPKYPYISYTITTPMSENNGTYGVYDDGTERKPITQIWSITAVSDDDIESVTLAVKAREWLDRVGTLYLKDNEVDVQRVGSITNRDTIVTIGYQYKKGFDVVFWLYDTLENVDADIEVIETVVINDKEIKGGEG